MLGNWMQCLQCLHMASVCLVRQAVLSAAVNGCFLLPALCLAPPTLPPPCGMQGWGQEQAQQPPMQRPPLVPPHLQPEQQRAFVAANQEVEQQLQAREQQLADLQARPGCC